MSTSILSYLTIENTPKIYRNMRFYKYESGARVLLGRVIEADLDAMQVLYMIGIQIQDWDRLSYLKAVERWGVKYVMRDINPSRSPNSNLHKKIPKNAVVEGVDCLRYSNPPVHGFNRVLKWTTVDRIVVELYPEQHNQAHLVHPNCAVKFLEKYRQNHLF